MYVLHVWQDGLKEFNRVALRIITIELRVARVVAEVILVAPREIGHLVRIHEGIRKPLSAFVPGERWQILEQYVDVREVEFRERVGKHIVHALAVIERDEIAITHAADVHDRLDLLWSPSEIVFQRAN